MELIETIVLPAGQERAWRLLQDVGSIASCIPGAELVEARGDGVYDGFIVFTLGPKKVKFSGSVSFEVDNEAFRGQLHAKGADASGSSRASGTVEYTVIPDGTDASLVTVISSVKFMGPLAGFAESGGVHVGRRIIGSFGECLASKVAAPEGAEADLIRAKPMSGIWVAVEAIWGRMRSSLRPGKKRRSQDDSQ